MHHPFALVALSLFLSQTLAFESIDAPYRITAGEPFEVDIENDLGFSSSFDADFDSFVVWLAMTPPGWGTGPVCSLSNDSIPIDTTSLTLTIPADVGPSGYYYSLSVAEYGGHGGGESGFQYSNDFKLVGGTGEWSEEELDGYVLWGDPSGLPCDAVACVRQCDGDDSCAAKCPGVVMSTDYDGNYSGYYSSSSYSYWPSATGSASGYMASETSSIISSGIHSASATPTAASNSTTSLKATEVSATRTATATASATETSNAAGSLQVALSSLPVLIGAVAVALLRVL
ncbi:MAG: hypothetical protein M1834_005204 [Cirrosporium novae-zelandiae]|nr:MAG: hypothetical protein M1834_005204 [Cirrosporium novae-zelandiae]